MEAINRSGTNEEFTEREQLLQDCVQLIRDDQSHSKELKASERHKQRKEEAAAHQMLAVAMGRISAAKRPVAGMSSRCSFVKVFFVSFLTQSRSRKQKRRVPTPAMTSRMAGTGSEQTTTVRTRKQRRRILSLNINDVECLHETSSTLSSPATPRRS